LWFCFFPRLPVLSAAAAAVGPPRGARLLPRGARLRQPLRAPASAVSSGARLYPCMAAEPRGVGGRGEGRCGEGPSSWRRCKVAALTSQTQTRSSAVTGRALSRGGAASPCPSLGRRPGSRSALGLLASPSVAPSAPPVSARFPSAAQRPGAWPHPARRGARDDDRNVGAECMHAALAAAGVVGVTPMRLVPQL